MHFYLSKQEDKLEIVALYVDDLILVTETQEEMTQMKTVLKDTIKMKDLGPLHYCLT